MEKNGTKRSNSREVSQRDQRLQRKNAQHLRGIWTSLTRPPRPDQRARLHVERAPQRNQGPDRQHTTTTAEPGNKIRDRRSQRTGIPRTTRRIQRPPTTKPSQHRRNQRHDRGSNPHRDQATRISRLQTSEPTTPTDIDRGMGEKRRSTTSTGCLATGTRRGTDFAKCQVRCELYCL